MEKEGIRVDIQTCDELIKIVNRLKPKEKEKMKMYVEMFKEYKKTKKTISFCS